MRVNMDVRHRSTYSWTPFIFSRWFCHFDDDNYVNVPALVHKLRQFDQREDWYLGKPSIPEPLEILDRDNNKVSAMKKRGQFVLCHSLSFSLLRA